jgi:hypothetical protein
MNFPTASDLAEIPGLVPWLTGNFWQEYYLPATLKTGATIPVNSIRLIEDDETVHAEDCEIIVDATFSTTQKSHRTRLFLDFPYDRLLRRQSVQFVSECTCSVEILCKHSVSVFEALKSIAAETPRLTHTQSIAAISTWLRKIKEAEKIAKIPKKPVKPAPPYNKFLAYCIAPHSHPFSNEENILHFTTRIGNLNKSGFSIESRTTTADPSRPAKYISAEDLPICAKIHHRSRKIRHWGSHIPIVGDDWEDILPAALATGRLYFGQDDEGYSTISPFQPLTEGPPLAVDLSWELLPRGEARPTLNLPSPETLLIHTEPLRYLDPDSLLIGYIQSPLSAALIRAWHEGPTVPAESITNLSNELASISPENPLPLPAEKPARILTGLTPTPILHITNVLVGIYQKRHIGGVLKFQYPGSQPFFPLATNEVPKTNWFDGEHRVILERDAAAESQLAETLKNHGLTPLHEVVPANELNEKNRHSVVLEHPTTRITDWLEFLDSPQCHALATAGWIIEADPKLNLTIHDIGDFFPAIEADTDRGIDWFRFDVTAEFDGKKISLIPQIARAISEDWHLRFPDPDNLPETILLTCDKPTDGHIRFPAKRFLEMLNQVRHLFHGNTNGDEPIRMDRLSAAGMADSLSIESSETTRALAELGRNLRDLKGLPPAEVPATLKADLRHYQLDGFRWLQFLAHHGLHGILADDMGLGKTVQTLAHLTAEAEKFPGIPSLVIAPTSVVPNWAAETEKFAPHLKILVLHGGDRADNFDQIPTSDIILTSYPLLVRDFEILSQYKWHVLVLDEAQYIKNPKAISAHCACKLRAAHRICLSGTPMENHLGELWSLMRFLMPGFLADEKTFNTFIRRPIERDHNSNAQIALNRRVSPLILRRTKDQVATELPEKTTLIHGIDLTPKQTDLYESVRAAMDERVRSAIADKGLAKSHIIVLDALLKLRQICCHPQLLKSVAAQRVLESAKLEYLTQELLPTLLEEGRRILIFSQFTSMLALIEEHLDQEQIPFLKLTGQTKERAQLVKKFQSGEIPIFLISLKAGGTGLNLTAADTVIHYDPWWNPAAENQATDRAHRIGQTKPVFVHKLVCRGTIEDRILELQKHKSALVEALLSEETTKLKIDAETLSHLLSPLS